MLFGVLDSSSVEVEIVKPEPGIQTIVGGDHCDEANQAQRCNPETEASHYSKISAKHCERQTHLYQHRERDSQGHDVQR